MSERSFDAGRHIHITGNERADRTESHRLPTSARYNVVLVERTVTALK
jgi:hypothetical protein